MGAPCYLLLLLLPLGVQLSAVDSAPNCTDIIALDSYREDNTLRIEVHNESATVLRVTIIGGPFEELLLWPLAEKGSCPLGSWLNDTSVKYTECISASCPNATNQVIIKGLDLTIANATFRFEIPAGSPPLTFIGVDRNGSRWKSLWKIDDEQQRSLDSDNGKGSDESDATITHENRSDCDDSSEETVTNNCEHNELGKDPLLVGGNSESSDMQNVSPFSAMSLPEPNTTANVSSEKSQVENIATSSQNNSQTAKSQRTLPTPEYMTLANVSSGGPQEETTATSSSAEGSSQNDSQTAESQTTLPTPEYMTSANVSSGGPQEAPTATSSSAEGSLQNDSQTAESQTTLPTPEYMTSANVSSGGPQEETAATSSSAAGSLQNDSQTAESQTVETSPKEELNVTDVVEEKRKDLRYKISFHLKGDYNQLVRPDKSNVINELRWQLAKIMNVSPARITNLDLAEGSVAVSFVVEEGAENEPTPEEAAVTLNQALFQGSTSSLSIEGTQLAAVGGSFKTERLFRSGASGSAVKSGERDGANLPTRIVVGAVFGGVGALILVIVIVVVIRKRRTRGLRMRQISKDPVLIEGGQIRRISQGYVNPAYTNR